MSGDSKKQGTIFLGDREVSYDQLPNLGGKRSLWGGGREEEYLDRVQRRAAQQAKEVLAEANARRAALLEEAGKEAARVLEEARLKAESLRAEGEDHKAAAAALREEADAVYAGAQEEGYNAGLRHAQADLENFRTVMGESVGAVLMAVQKQCDLIFSEWKEELCALVRICVEKGLGWTLSEERTRVLEELLAQAVRLLDKRGLVVVRVHPEDEAAVADMFAAAAERMPGLAGWTVQGDPDMAPGGLVLEGPHNRVESRLEERKAAVEAALRHLTLPPVPAEEEGRALVEQAGREAALHMPLPEHPDPEQSAGPEHFAEAEPPVAPAPDAFAEPAVNEPAPEAPSTVLSDDTQKFLSGEEPFLPDSPPAETLPAFIADAPGEFAPPAESAKPAGPPRVDMSVVMRDLAAASAPADDPVPLEGGFWPATREPE